MTEVEQVQFAVQLVHASGTPVETRRHLAQVIIDIADHEAPTEGNMTRRIAWKFASIYAAEMTRLRAELAPRA